MTFVTYKEKVRSLSKKVVLAQKPIRILNSIRTPEHWEDELLRSKFTELPKDAKGHYESLALNFDVAQKTAELNDLKSEIRRILGEADEIGKHLQTICDQYLMVVEMLAVRGRPEFYTMSRQLYGSPKDCFKEDTNTIASMAHLLYEILSGIGPNFPEVHYPEDITSEGAVQFLNQRFSQYFADENVIAKLSDNIVADASAGGDKVKIREGAMFSQRDLELYEVHEGWVHVGTTLNGRRQPVCEFLSIGPPRCASTQEGLAVIMEIFTFRTFLSRARQINDRIICIEKAEDGADLLQVIDYLRTEGYSDNECVKIALRVFRGGTVTGGAPFTKDISYCKGFVENYNFLRSCVRASMPHLIPFMFLGKVHVEDIPMLYAKYTEGLIEAPQFLPPHFRDLNGLAVWMSFSSFFNRVDLQSVQEHYKKLFDRHV